MSAATRKAERRMLNHALRLFQKAAGDVEAVRELRDRRLMLAAPEVPESRAKALAFETAENALLDAAARNLDGGMRMVASQALRGTR